MKLPTEDLCRVPPVESRIPPLQDATTVVSTADRMTPVQHIHERVVDYSEYMWMGEEMEEFDRKCLEEIMEDDFIETCFEEMLEEEDEIYEFVEWFCEEFDDEEPEVVIQNLQALALFNNVELEFLQDPTGKGCTLLNPYAREFVPTSAAAFQVPPTLTPDVPFDR